MSYRIDNFIDGETTESRSERFGAIFDPATGQQQGTVALSTAAECLDAIASAERAFADWSQTPPLVRARVMFRSRYFSRFPSAESSSWLRLRSWWA